MPDRYLIFSDESGYNAGTRYGSLAKITGPLESTRNLNETLKKYLKAANKVEFKFNEVKNNASITLAHKFIDTAFDFIRSSKIRIYILTWDKHDSRHTVQNRSDIENLKRMYYHHLHFIKKDWNVFEGWEFYPDQLSAIDWENDVIAFLTNKKIRRNPIEQTELFESLNGINIKYRNVKELNSATYPIIQLADLFAGMIRSSRENSDAFYEWFTLEKTKHQVTLFDYERQTENSKNILYKFEVMKYFKFKADSLKLGINLSKSKYFSKLKGGGNINIWHYEPQGDYDKAPEKIRNLK